MTEYFDLSSNKECSLVFVKLTDEALLSLEKYKEHEADNRFKSSIQFKGDKGVLMIPTKNHTDSFEFALMDENCSSGSFQCVEKSEKGGLTSLGNIETKMQFLAKKSSLKQTKSKIEEIAMAQKKYGTKVITTVTAFKDNSSQDKKLNNSSHGQKQKNHVLNTRAGTSKSVDDEQSKRKLKNKGKNYDPKHHRLNAKILELEAKILKLGDDRLAEMEANKLVELEAKKLAELEAKKQAKLEAKKQAKLEAKKQAKLEAKKQAELEAKKVWQFQMQARKPQSSVNSRKPSVAALQNDDIQSKDPSLQSNTEGESKYAILYDLGILAPPKNTKLDTKVINLPGSQPCVKDGCVVTSTSEKKINGPTDDGVKSSSPDAISMQNDPYYREIETMTDREKHRMVYDRFLDEYNQLKTDSIICQKYLESLGNAMRHAGTLAVFNELKGKYYITLKCQEERVGKLKTSSIILSCLYNAICKFDMKHKIRPYGEH